MHKKLTADLISLAHSILQMKNREDVFALKQKSYEVYEKLSVLAYVEEYINNTPNPEHTKEELLDKIESITNEKIAEEKPEVKVVAEEEIIKHDLEEVVEEIEEEVVEEKDAEVELTVEENEVESVDLPIEAKKEEEEVTEEIKEVEPAEDLFTETETEAEAEVEIETEIEEKVEEEVLELVSTKEEKAPSLKEELKDTIAVDVVADLFENTPKKSLNDKLQGDIQIGLNDRIAFVKNLFGGSQEDFNRVVSQLNTLKTEKEAKKFINKMVKPDYDWTDKEELEERFMSIVERKFA